MTVDVAVLLWGVLVCAFVLIGFVTGEWGAVRRDLQRRRPAAPVRRPRAERSSAHGP